MTSGAALDAKERCTVGEPQPTLDNIHHHDTTKFWNGPSRSCMRNDRTTHAVAQNDEGLDCVIHQRLCNRLQILNQRIQREV